jgi:hypothetical protein
LCIPLRPMSTILYRYRTLCIATAYIGTECL